MRRKTAPESPLLLPFEPGPASNGEFVPRAPTARERAAAALAHERAAALARHHGVDRRQFLMSLSGLAVTFGAINQLACSATPTPTLDSSPGTDAATALPDGAYDVPLDASPAACESLSGAEFIFDVQTHHVNPRGPWVQNSPGTAQFLGFLRGSCGEATRLECLNRYHYMRDLYLESDTSMTVLSDTPSAGDPEDPLTFEEMRRTREIMDSLSGDGAGRILLHSALTPNVGPVQQTLDLMQARAESMRVAAWKVYTPWGPDGRGWFLDDPALGIPLIERARSLGINRICAHKGLPLPGFSVPNASPRDIGVVARMFPDVQFVVYHSGYDPSKIEGPYDPANADIGVDALIKSVLDNGIAPNTNVWAELGSTFRNVMTDPTQAAHVLGKLLRYIGEDRILWGTDCIWYGSPQPQIVALRALQITETARAMYGYPELTPAIKAKIFGLNAARLYGIDATARRCALRGDDVERYRMSYNEYRDRDPEPRWHPRGPTTRAGMLAHLRRLGGRFKLG